MAVTPSGSVSLPLQNFKTQLSNSATFISMVGAANAAAALAYIHIQAIDDSVYARPCALIWHESIVHPMVARGAASSFAESGVLSFRIERDISSSYKADGSESDAYLEFTNIIGAILSELEARTDLDIHEIAVETIERTPVEDEAEGTYYYSVTGQVTWGTI